MTRTTAFDVYHGWKPGRVFLTPAQAAHQNGFTVAHMLKQCRAGAVIPCIQVSGRYFIAPIHVCPPPSHMTTTKRPRFPRVADLPDAWAFRLGTSYAVAKATVQSASKTR